MNTVYLLEQFDTSCRDGLNWESKKTTSTSASLSSHISHQQEEIELLMRENEELKSRNEILESQLKTPLDPSKTNAGQTEDKTVDPVVLEELSNNLQTATDVCEKIKQDMDKLKEVRVCHCHTVVVTRNLAKGKK